MRDGLALLLPKVSYSELLTSPLNVYRSFENFFSLLGASVGWLALLIDTRVNPLWDLPICSKSTWFFSLHKFTYMYICAHAHACMHT